MRQPHRKPLLTTESSKMKQKAFHIAANGAIEACRKFPRCGLENHWAEARSAEIHLDNLAYVAERDAKVAEFNAIRRDIGHPQHYRVSFDTSSKSTSGRKFGEEMANHVAHYGSLPSYLCGSLRFRMKYLSNIDLRVFIETEPVIDMKTAQVTRQWTATYMEYKKRLAAHEMHLTGESAHETVVEKLYLNFNDDQNIKQSLARLEAMFAGICRRRDPVRSKRLDVPVDDYTVEVNQMMDRFMDMFNAIEGVTRLGELWQHGYGDFKGCVDSDDKVVVDVEYGRSTFSAQTFKDFVRSNHYFRGCTIDADIRVTDSRGRDDYGASWSVYRKDGIWRVATTCWDGQRFDTVAPTAEEVRGHIYWQMMNEIDPDNQEKAFKVSQYAADLFTMVESELAAHNG